LKEGRDFTDTIAAAFDGFELIVETFNEATGDACDKVIEDGLPVGT
jgi:hypothetical protein